jgi:hypothetical protein
VRSQSVAKHCFREGQDADAGERHDQLSREAATTPDANLAKVSIMLELAADRHTVTMPLGG